MVHIGELRSSFGGLLDHSRGCYFGYILSTYYVKKNVWIGRFSYESNSDIMKFTVERLIERKSRKYINPFIPVR